MNGEFVYGDDLYCLDEYLDELWDFIQGFPDYRISNCGRVYSSISNLFLKPYLMNGYHFGVGLRYNKVRYSMYIHQMVANAFIPNPDNLPIVRHLDDDPENNTVWNLAWGTQSDNNRDAIENGSRMGKPWVPVRVITTEGIFVGDFASQHEASRSIDVSVASISCALDDGRKVKGFIFERLF